MTEQDHLRDSFGFTAKELAAKNADVFSSRRPGRTRRRTRHYFGAGEDTIYLVGHGGRRGVEERYDRLRPPLRVPRGYQARERVRPRRPGGESRAQVKLICTNSFFDPAKEKKAAEAWSVAGATTIGQNVDRPAAGQEAQATGIRGSATTRREEVRAHLVADRLGLQLGPVLPEPVKAATDGSWKTGSYYGE